MLRKWINTSLLLIGMGCIGVAFADAQPQDKEKEGVKQAYENWCSAIGSAKGNASEVVKYYAPDAILLPTLSAKKLVNKDGGLDAYFQKLTSLKDIKCTPDRSTIKIHGKVATNSGFYTFSFKNKEDKEKSINARFNFIYKKDGDQWLIVNHHSSKTPEE